MMHKMYITGDCHGEKNRLTYSEFAYNRDLKKGDILFICGDFGYLMDDSFAERQYLNYLANELPYSICFVDGNHENFDLINSFPVEKWNGGKVHIIRRSEEGEPKIIHLMRGQVFNIYGKKIFTFGGAFSVDRSWRRLGESYWEEELPNDEEMRRGNRNLEAHDYRVDYILTHAAPQSTMAMYHHGHEEERALGNYLEYVREKVSYEHWYMGHLHREEDIWRNQTILWFGVKDLITGEWVE